jgi:hypothetical protein
MAHGRGTGGRPSGRTRQRRRARPGISPTPSPHLSFRSSLARSLSLHSKSQRSSPPGGRSIEPAPAPAPHARRGNRLASRACVRARRAQQATRWRSWCCAAAPRQPSTRPRRGPDCSRRRRRGPWPSPRLPPPRRPARWRRRPRTSAATGSWAGPTATPSLPLPPPSPPSRGYACSPSICSIAFRSPLGSSTGLTPPPQVIFDFRFLALLAVAGSLAGSILCFLNVSDLGFRPIHDCFGSNLTHSTGLCRLKNTVEQGRCPQSCKTANSNWHSLLVASVILAGI